MQQYLLKQSNRHNFLDKQLLRLSPQNNITYLSQMIRQKRQQIINLIQQKITQSRHQFVLQTSQLNSVSPLATLERGYSVTTNQQNTVVRRVEQVNVGEFITTRLANGQLTSQIIDMQNKDNY